jgi:hypothetical protein
VGSLRQPESLAKTIIRFRLLPVLPQYLIANIVPDVDGERFFQMPRKSASEGRSEGQAPFPAHDLGKSCCA